MPQAADELRAMWPGSDDQAIPYLEGRGFHYNFTEHCWRLPWPAFPVSDLDRSAIDYMAAEWDFGGLEE